MCGQLRGILSTVALVLEFQIQFERLFRECTVIELRTLIMQSLSFRKCVPCLPQLIGPESVQPDIADKSQKAKPMTF